MHDADPKNVNVINKFLRKIKQRTKVRRKEVV